MPLHPAPQPLSQLHWVLAPSPQGLALLGASADGLHLLLLGEAREELLADMERRMGKVALRPAEDGLAERLRALAAGLGEKPPEMRLAPRGTAFQLQVWAALRAIPKGQTRSYGALAEAIGAPGSSRAVAGACAANPIAVLIPCHRVLRADGGLSGYRWGVERKRALLAHEGALPAHSTTLSATLSAA